MAPNDKQNNPQKLVHANDSFEGIASLRPVAPTHSEKSLNGIAALRPTVSQTSQSTTSGSTSTSKES
jgi:hypothetical protein